MYVDLNSPYAYLALERAEAVLGMAPEVEPILLGGMFQRRGWGSWAHTEQRDARLAELSARAARYGVPPLRYPDGWPLNGLTTLRAATWGKMQGRTEAFCRAVMRRQFVDGEDCSGVAALVAVAESVGVSGVEAAVADPAVKTALREATDAAWDAGVRGIPALRVGDALYYGDDALEAAAAGAPPPPAPERDGYVISTDPARLDLDHLHAFLTESYWSPGITRERVARAAANSLCFGLYAPGGAQAGYARVVTDRASFGYLADVFVDPAHRGRGLGVRLVETVLAHPDLQGLRRWLLFTSDAHGLYARFGFVPSAPDNMMIRRA